MDDGPEVPMLADQWPSRCPLLTLTRTCFPVPGFDAIDPTLVHSREAFGKSSAFACCNNRILTYSNTNNNNSGKSVTYSGEIRYLFQRPEAEIRYLIWEIRYLPLLVRNRFPKHVVAVRPGIFRQILSLP